MEKPRGDRNPGYVVQGEWRACLVVPRRRRKKLFAERGRPEGRVHRWQRRGDVPRSVGHILVSWRWRSLVPAGFSPHPAPCDTDGPAGSARWPFSRLGFRSVPRYGAGVGNCRRIARHPPVGRCRPAQ